MSGPPQHVYVGQNETSVVPSQPIGYGFQPQFIPGMRPGSGPAGNFIIPYPLQRQPQIGPRMGFRRGATNMQQHIQQQQVC